MTPPKTIAAAAFLCVCLLFTKAKGQITSPYNFKFKNYTTQNGLVHNFTKKCRKDGKGFLWIITQNGLSRFDGANFKNFQNKQGDSTSLPYNDIFDIAIDKYDKVWLAYGKGLCVFDQKTQVFTVIRSALNTEAVSLVYDTAHNTIWYNTYKGMFKVDAQHLNVAASSQQADYIQRPYATCIDSKGQVWTGIERLGYYVYNTNNNTYRYYNCDCWPRSFDEDNEGNMWISTWESGLQLFDNKDGKNTNATYEMQHEGLKYATIYQNMVQSAPLTGNNILWMLTHTNGLALFDKTQRKFIKEIKYDAATKSGLLSNFSTSMYVDREGIIWICSWRGLSKINKQEQQFQSAEIPALETNYYNLLSGIVDDPYDPNICWMAVHGSGIAKYNKATHQIVQRYFFSSKSTKVDEMYNWRWVSSIHKDFKNRLWLPTYGGAICIDKGNVSKVPANWDITKNYTFDGKVLDDGNFWTFTRNGLAKLNTDTKQYTFYKNKPDTAVADVLANHIYDAVFINPTTLLCGTADGLHSFDVTTHAFKKINIKFSNTASDKWKRFMTLQKINNKVYCGTESGLLEYDLETQEALVKGKEQEIFKLELSSLIKDPLNKLWIYTLHGLFRYDPAKDEFKKFTSLDGIYDNSSDPVQMFAYNNDFYIGYRMAYTKFNPAEVDINNNKVKPFITELRINNQPQKIFMDSFATATLHLDYRQNNIVFDFTGIDYTTSERISFAHKLEGFDKDWVYDGTRRTATYANLSGDRYIFKVKACNSSGTWNNETAMFRLYIHPPFWQTWWFKILMALLFIGTVVLIAVNRVKAIRKKEEEKTSVNKMMAELEMRALRSQMNPHFIFNSLNSIQKYIWDNKQEDASEYLTKFSKLMRIILNNSMHKLVTLEEELVSLQLYLELEHRRCNNKFDYAIHVGNNIMPNQVLVPPMLMQPYIENAIWHGLLQKEGRGKLAISIQQPSMQMLTCMIEDDGIGRKKAEELKNRKENKAVSYGMQITQQRLSIAETDGRIGKVMIDDLMDDGIACGTRITLEIPIETFQKIG